MDSPLRGRTRQLTNKVEATVPINIHNRFDVEVIDIKTGKIRQRAQAENVICNNLWTRLLSPNRYFTYIHYGTGSGTPTATDTRLFAFLGYGLASNPVYTKDIANRTYSVCQKIQLSETTAVGNILTEVGIGYDTTATTLCTHAMLKDANGNQISIAKSNTDIINIYATVFAHISDQSASGVIYQHGDGLASYLCGMVSTYGAAIYPYIWGINQGMHSPGSSQIGYASQTYNVAAKTMTIVATRAAVGDNNLSGGIRSLRLGHDFELRGGTPWFNGSDIVGEAIGTGDGTKVDFATKFNAPIDATIYLDGVATTDATVSCTPHKFSDPGDCLNVVQWDGKDTKPYIWRGSDIDKPAGDTTSYAGAYTIFENLLYQTNGLSSVSIRYATLECSNDLSTWIQIITETSGTDTAKSIPTDYRNYRYWKLTNTFSGSGSSHYGDSVAGRIKSVVITPELVTTNIHFNTPPTLGAVITADYHTPVIAKDANHVFDLTVTIQLGEYAE